MSLAAADSETTTDSAQFSAQQLYEQVTVAEVAVTAQLTSQQIQQLIPLLQQVEQKRIELVSSADELWGQHEQSIQQALTGEIAGRPVAGDARQKAGAAISAFAQRRTEFDRYLATIVSQVQSQLTAQQRVLIEPPQPGAFSQPSPLELDSPGSIAEYIVAVTDVQRALRPDEYALVRIPQAERIAAEIVGPTSPQFRAVVDQVVQLTDMLYSWSQERYIQERPTLADQVAGYLQLPPPSAKWPISQQRLFRFLSSPYTIGLLQRMAAGTTPQALPTEAKAIEDYPLVDAADIMDLTGLLNYLQLSVAQLDALARVVQQIKPAVESVRSPWINQGESFNNSLTLIRDLLLTTGQVAPEWQQFRTNLAQQRHRGRWQVAEQLAQVERILTPGQNEVIDWRPPAGILAASSQRLVRQQTRLLGEMRIVIEVWERVKYFDPEDYRRLRIRALNQLLESYGITQDSPDYPQYRAFGLEVLSQVRQTPLDQWEQHRIFLALDFLRELGIIEPLVAGPGTGVPVTWEDIYRALSYPQASQVIQQMIVARTTGQVPQQLELGAESKH